jgi:hypothetical protein
MLNVCATGHRRGRRSGVSRLRRGFFLLVPTLGTSAILLLSSAVPPASAESTFNCQSLGKGATCNQISGPNETLDWFEGANYTYAEFFLEIWKYNGGSNYNKETGYTVFAYTGSHCTTSKSGHGGVFLQNAPGNIAGRQRNHC